MRNGLLVTLVVAWAMFTPSATAGEGFGMLKKKTVTLHRERPPEIELPGTRIRLSIINQVPEREQLANRLRTLVQTELAHNQPGLEFESTQPNAKVELTLLDARLTQRDEFQRRNRTKRDALRKTHLEEVQVRVRVIVVVLRVAYRVEAVGGRTLGGDTIERSTEERFEEGRPSPDPTLMEDAALVRVAEEIASKITRSSEEVTALVPKGSLERYASLAEAGAWNEYLEKLETEANTQNAPAERRAYVSYARGLAHEALAYAAETPAAAIDALQDADQDYRTAFTLWPEEKYFLKPYAPFVRGQRAQAPLDRVKAALSQYQQLDARIKRAEKGGAQPVPPTQDGSKSGDSKRPTEPPSPRPARQEKGVVNNSDVIRLVTEGHDEAVIVGMIRGARRIRFDLSTTGLAELQSVGASEQVIAAMRQRILPPLPPRRRQGVTNH